MSASNDSQYDALTEAQMVLVNRLCNQFEAKWRSGQTTAVEEFLHEVPVEDRLAALGELLPLEIEYRIRAGQSLSLEHYIARFPELDRSWLGELLDTTRVAERPTLIQDPDDLSEIPEKLGDYRIVSRIGGGGMGTVYKAVHERMGRTVALKVLRSEIQRDPKLLKRFDREVRTAARLSHPNIVAALDAREQDGIHFLITEFVDAIDLQATVIRTGPLNVIQAVDCILQAARGLDYAHQQGVIHRDIKPANLLRDHRGVVKILDMGLARMEVPDDATATDLTQSGMVMGTAAYMSPEQARNTRRADARSDIYSLGCTLFYLLNGRSIFVGESVIDTIISHVSHPIPALARTDLAVPVDLIQIFQRMVAKDPEQRFQSAAELITALEKLRDELPASKWISPDEFAADSTAMSTPRDQTQIDLKGKLDSSQTEIVVRDVKPPRRQSSGRKWSIVVLLALVVGSIGMALLLPPNSLVRPMGPGIGLRFDGRSSYVAVPAMTPEAGETYTLEAIVQPLGFPPASNVISWLGPDWMALFFLDHGYVGACRRVGNESYLIRSKVGVTLGETIHVAGVYRGRDLKLFINGRPAEPIPFQFELPETTGGLHLGGVPLSLLPDGQNIRFIDGTIREVRISRGIRYSMPFVRPAQLNADAKTIGLFRLSEGQGNVTYGTGERQWVGKIVNARWQLRPTGGVTP